eukprot:NODE_551_length_6164_cov_0.432811.p6 type:complete len:204 gc:universal NODE_551_length_6164_cov_0.432811:5221-4610(-)
MIPIVFPFLRPFPCIIKCKNRPCGIGFDNLFEIKGISKEPKILGFRCFFTQWLDVISFNHIEIIYTILLLLCFHALNFSIFSISRIHSKYTQQCKQHGEGTVCLFYDKWGEHVVTPKHSGRTILESKPINLLISLFFNYWTISIFIQFIFNCRFLILLIFRHQIIHITLCFSKFHFIHTLSSIPMQKCFSLKHGHKLRINTLK